MWSLLVTAWAAGQGQALQLHYPTEPGLAAVSVRWSGHDVPFFLSGDRWFATVGVDLDSRPGDHAVNVTFSYDDGRTRVANEPVIVGARAVPDDGASSRGALRRAQPGRPSSCRSRGRRDDRDLRHLHARALLDGGVRSPGAGRERRAELRPSSRLQRPAAGTALGRGPARHDGYADLRGEPRASRAGQGPVLQRERRVHRPRLRPLHDLSAPLEDRRRRRRYRASAGNSSASRGRPAG